VTGPKTNEREGTRARLRGAPMSAFKVREVLDLIRGQEVGRAADILRFCERGAAETVGKVLASAVANAAANDELDPEELFVSACYADEGKTQRRMRPRARGRANRRRKRSAHITVIVSRLPEGRLARLRAQRAAEQASRRTRRGGRGAAATPADRARRTGRRPAEESVAEESVAEEALAEGIVDVDAAAVEAADAAAAEEHVVEASDIAEPADAVTEGETENEGDEPDGSVE
jgi:large subunit ribosomal protein L22